MSFLEWRGQLRFTMSIIVSAAGTASFVICAYGASDLSKTKKNSEPVDSEASRIETINVDRPEEFKSNLVKYKAQVEKNPKDVKSRLLLGKAYYYSGQLDQALEHLKFAAREPTLDTLTILSQIYEKKADYLELIRSLELILETHPNEFRVRTRLGLAYYKAKKKKEAVENLKLAIKTNPKYRPAYEALASIFDDQKNYYEQRLVYSDMLNVFPPDSRILSQYCRLHALDGFFEKARDICQAAIDKDSQVPENHVYLALALKGLENPKQAQQIIFAAAKRFKKSEITQFYAGQFSDDKKSWESSIMYYENAISSDPKSSRGFMGLAVAAFKASSYKKSLEAFLSACKSDRNAYIELTKTTQLLRMKKESQWYEEFRKKEPICKMALKLDSNKKPDFPE